MKYRYAFAALVAVGLLVLSSGCGSGTPSEEMQGETGEVPTVEAAVTLSAPEAEETPGASGGGTGSNPSPEVAFETSDGVTLKGTLFGTGENGIVLSHMYPTDQTSWHPFAQVAADEGYLVLTYDYRGYGASGGQQDIPSIDLDTRAAYDFIRTQGASRVVLIGASIGGTASIKVAATAGAELVGLVVLSSPQEFHGLEVTQPELDALTMPSLWLSARNDTVTPKLEGMYDAAAGPDKSLWVFEGSSTHGTFIFDAPLDGADLEGRLLDFLGSVAPVT